VNISASVLDSLAYDLKRITKPGGKLIISGFIRENPPRFFVPAESMERGEWLCWVCRPETITTSAIARDQVLLHRPDWWV
jgi:ribosomal protein L11 methylase PrmA